MLAAFHAQDWTRTSTRLHSPAAGAAGDPLALKLLRAARFAAGAISCSQLINAQDRTRTSTRLLPLAPQASASTNSATCADNADRSTTASGGSAYSTFRIRASRRSKRGSPGLLWSSTLVRQIGIQEGCKGTSSRGGGHQSICDDGHLPHVGIEGVAQTIADVVDGENGHENAQAGEDCRPPRDREIRSERLPACCPMTRSAAECPAEKRKPGFENDDVRLHRGCLERRSERSRWGADDER